MSHSVLNVYSCAGCKQSRPAWVSPLYHPMIYDVYLGRVNENTAKKKKIKFVLWTKTKRRLFLRADKFVGEPIWAQ